MREIEDDVRRARRKRLLARGGAAEYRDADIYEHVDIVLRRALEARDHDALLLPDFLSSDPDWQLTTHLRFTSHRPVIGPLLIFVKRRILLPLTRWLYEYSLENFRRQQQLNTVLFACIEELAIENAKLRTDGQEAAGRAGRARRRGGQVGRAGRAGRTARVKLACVVHRFGADIAGGSEAHCRHVAERLAAHHDVTVLTTCAKDHVTWRNEYPAGEIAARLRAGPRFPVARQRSLHRFKDISEIAFSGTRDRGRAGRVVPRERSGRAGAARRYLRDARPRLRSVLFWAFRYAEVYFGLPLVADRAILVPTAEEDPVIRHGRARAVLLAARRLHLSDARRAGARRTPHAGRAAAVVRRRLGARARRPARRWSTRDARRHARRSCCIWAAIDPNKGCETLLQHFIRFKAEHDDAGAARHGRPGQHADSRSSGDQARSASWTIAVREALLAQRVAARRARRASRA